MSLVREPLTRPEPRSTFGAAATVRAMEIGQHVMAVAFTTIGLLRALGDGVAPAAAVIAAVAILACHTAGSVIPARTRSSGLDAWWLLGLTAVWMAASAVSAEFVWLAFLLWLLAGHILPLRWGVVYSAIVLAVVVLAPILQQGTTSYANVFGPLIGGFFAFCISRGYLQLLRDAAERERLVASLTSAQAEMAALQDELALAQRQSGAIVERTRISRDLHDTVAQALSSIRLVAHAGAARSDDADAARALTQVEGLAADSLGDVRRIVAALAPAELEENALAAALQRILDRARGETGIEVELHVDESLPALSTEAEVALLRTAQSALANVRLHSGATRVVASLIDGDTTVRLDLIDNGSGFTPDALEPTGETVSGYGLRFMRARLRELGGGLDVESAPGEGTAISAYLPIRAEQNRPVGPALEAQS